MKTTLQEALSSIDDKAIDEALEILESDAVATVEKDKKLQKEPFSNYKIKNTKYTIYYSFRSIRERLGGGAENMYGELVLGCLFDARGNSIYELDDNTKDEINKIIAEERDFSVNDFIH